jgi:hypothetical protein
MFQVLFMVCALHGYRAPLENKVDPHCFDYEHVRAWVYFTDKGIYSEELIQAIHAVHRALPEKTLERRLLRGKTLIDYADLPLDEDYIRRIEENGGVLIQRSKWLNAASFWISRDDIDRIAALDIVYRISIVARFQGPQDKEATILDSLIFGLAYKQIKMFHVDSLHQAGYFGSGIIVGILDTGLRTKHVALENVHVVAEHDFCEGDRIYLEGLPIIDRSGVFTDIEFVTTPTRLHVFATGDTIAYQIYPVRDVLHTYSTDNGTTWQPLTRVTDNFNNWAEELDVCGNDTFYIFYRDKSGIQWIAYTDTTIASGSFAGTVYREPSAVCINDTLWVFYQGRNHLYMRKGTINGFPGSPIAIDSSKNNIKQPRAITNGADLGVFYHTYPSDSLFFLSGSVSDTMFARSFMAHGANARAVCTGDTIVLAWKDISTSPLCRVGFTVSTNFGISFRTFTYLSDDLNSINGLSIARSGNAVSVTWESEGRIYRRDSYDLGMTFGLTDTVAGDFAYVPTLGVNAGSIVELHCMRGDSITDGYASGHPDYWHPRHGTEMLAIIGGYARNNYIGIAPAAQFIVAKTENPDTSPPYEFPVEEDTWVNGLEWMEANGVDIVNSSLGYTHWYVWPEDYDGKHSPASIAAEQAALRGVIICNSSGNVSVPQIDIPADAEGIITVGGIDTLMSRWQYSGYYPTPDHSLKKPEIVCLADAPIVVNPDSVNSYLYSRGTSGASALIAGMCALLLDGHPTWNIDSVTTALYTTASHWNSPSDSIGYGWPDLWAAFTFSPFDTLPEGPSFLTPYPNPFVLTEQSTVFLPFKLDMSYIVEFRIYSISGRLIIVEKRPGTLLPGYYDSENAQSANAAFMWDGRDDNGDLVASGLYYCVMVTRGGGSDITKIAVVR